MTPNMHVHLSLTPAARAEFIVRTGQIWDGSAHLDLTAFTAEQRRDLLGGLGIPDVNGILDARTHNQKKTETDSVPGSTDEWLAFSRARAAVVKELDRQHEQAMEEKHAQAARQDATALEQNLTSLAEYEAVNDELLKTMKPGAGMPHVDPVTPEIRARFEICQQRHRNLWMQGETERRNVLNEKTLVGVEAATDAQLLTAGEPSLYTPVTTDHQERREVIRARLNSLREGRKAARLSWVLKHGSEHLRGAVAGGYDCKRLYVTERAALEYPGYVLDYDGKARYADVTCPLPEALKEALWVKGSVVFLTNSRREDDWIRFLPENGQAVVIRGFLGEYALLRPYKKDEEK